MKHLLLYCILFITVSCYSQNSDIKLRAEIYSVADSILTDEFGSNYYGVDQELKFGLILFSNSSCYVDN